MNMAIKTKTWSVLKELKEATFHLNISNFGEAKLRLKKGECIRSEEVSVGRSAFFVDIFPCGVEDADVGKISVCLTNKSNTYFPTYLGTLGKSQGIKIYMYL